MGVASAEFVTRRLADPERVFGGTLVAFTALFLAVLVLRPYGDTGLMWFSDIALTGTTVAGGIVCILVALQMTGRDRLSWMLMGTGTLCWGLGMVAWSWYELVLQQETPFPSLADLGYLAMIPFMFVGLLALPAGRIPAEGRIKASLDAMLIMVGIATVSWYAVLGPIYAEAEIGFTEKVIGLAYPAGDVLLMFALVSGVARGWIARRDPVLIPLVSGIVLFIVADLGFTYLTLHDAYASGNPIDIGWPLGFLLVSYAAVRRWVRGRSG